MAERALSRLWRWRPDPPPCAGSKSFSPRFTMTGRADAFPILKAPKGTLATTLQVRGHVREFSPIEPAVFIAGRVLVLVPVSCAGSIEIWRRFWLFQRVVHVCREASRPTPGRVAGATRGKAAAAVMLRRCSALIERSSVMFGDQLCCINAGMNGRHPFLSSCLLHHRSR